MSEVFVSFLPAALVAIEAGARKAAWAAGDVLRNKVVENLTGPRSGRTYRIPGGSGTYTASAPGEYPAMIPSGPAAGYLRSRIKIQMATDGVQVGTPVEYGLFLEKKPVSDGGRPWLHPSYKEAKGDMERKAAERWF